MIFISKIGIDDALQNCIESSESRRDGEKPLTITTETTGTTETTTGTDTAVDAGPAPAADGDLLDTALATGTAAAPALLTPLQMAAATQRLARDAVRHPAVVARHTAELAAELTRVALGRSEVAPEPGDRRFSDPAWRSNPLYKRLGQGYLAWNRTVTRTVEELEPDPKARLRSRFVTALFTEAVAPTNTLLGNPAALKEAFRTRGRSLYDGARHAAHDLLHNGAMPSMVDTRPFVVGETIAVTPGAVVFRSEVIEVLQYTPTTGEVRERPLLIVPPQINRHYVLDLAPGRSLVEHAVANGQQVFMVVWRNPRPEHRHWGLDTYLSAVLEAMDATLEITGQDDLNLVGVCAGGITTAALLGHLAAVGDRRVHSATFLVTILDWEVPSTVGTMVSRPVVAAAIQASQARGVLSGRDLGRLFAWLRPNDLVWNYWVNNYLMGKNPPAFDVLAWNADATNLPAALHADFMNMAADNALAHPGRVTALGTPVDLGAVTVDNYVVGAVTDHITPWDACYPTVNLLGGESTFVLSSSGHIQALVNPPGNPKARYYTNDHIAPTAEEWRATATEQVGSWWEHWQGWLAPRSGGWRPAPERLGSDAHPAGDPAPGRYVLD
jgi:polyhydroxyalkanoate synthase